VYKGVKDTAHTTHARTHARTHTHYLHCTYQNLYMKPFCPTSETFSLFPDWILVFVSEWIQFYPKHNLLTCKITEWWCCYYSFKITKCALFHLTTWWHHVTLEWSRDMTEWWCYYSFKITIWEYLTWYHNKMRLIDWLIDWLINWLVFYGTSTQDKSRWEYLSSNHSKMRIYNMKSQQAEYLKWHHNKMIIFNMISQQGQNI